MQIYGPTQVHGPQAVRAPHTARVSQAATTGATSASDQLDLSPVSQFVNQVRDLPDVRQDRVSQIRSALANGTYDSAQKLDGALNRLLDEIG
jgi:negative regulator of flagellin synthesis FlgM